MASINPLGERARGNRWWRTAVAYTAGCLLGGWALGATAGLTGLVGGAAIPDHGGRLVVAAALLALAAGVVELAGWRIPSVRRQVDDAWLARYRGWVYGSGFGLQLGAGLVTTVTTAAVYATAALAFVLGAGGHLGWAQVTGALFGLARSTPVLSAARLADADRVRRRGAAMAAAAGPSRLATGSVLCVLAALTVVAG